MGLEDRLYQNLAAPALSSSEQGRTYLGKGLRHAGCAWQEYKLVADTLFLAVSYLDRYLSLKNVPRARLQLVGITCMLLAAKYEEIYAPQVPTRRWLNNKPACL